MSETMLRLRKQFYRTSWGRKQHKLLENERGVDVHAIKSEANSCSPGSSSHPTTEPESALLNFQQEGNQYSHTSLQLTRSSSTPCPSSPASKRAPTPNVRREKETKQATILKHLQEGASSKCTQDLYPDQPVKNGGYRRFADISCVTTEPSVQLDSGHVKAGKDLSFKQKWTAFSNSFRQSNRPKKEILPRPRQKNSVLNDEDQENNHTFAFDNAALEYSGIGKLDAPVHSLPTDHSVVIDISNNKEYHIPSH
ncbi:hypothetical protein PHET_07789 [Paragonimus heterotremus]|uniref:Uncharacterized protein n=1 Tax=Paragonimus heterotremus TaxID=100268 RepID=A0A8J4WQ06_9TREM|nr:hypothetical protein PHET_07789 [Paragonimus heterotremus]